MPSKRFRPRNHLASHICTHTLPFFWLVSLRFSSLSFEEARLFQQEFRKGLFDLNLNLVKDLRKMFLSTELVVDLVEALAKNESVAQLNLAHNALGPEDDQ